MISRFLLMRLFINEIGRKSEELSRNGNQVIDLRADIYK